MKETLYQDIFSILESGLPATWEELVVFIAYTEGSYTMKYYVREQNQYRDCFQFQNSGELVKQFLRMDALLRPERVASPKNERWSVMTMCVKVDGSMKADYDYQSVEESLLDYERGWKERYLRVE